jgi:hypothetical protein
MTKKLPLGRNQIVRALLAKSKLTHKPKLYERVILWFQGVDWKTTTTIKEI